MSMNASCADAHPDLGKNEAVVVVVVEEVVQSLGIGSLAMSTMVAGGLGKSAGLDVLDVAQISTGLGSCRTTESEDI